MVQMPELPHTLVLDVLSGDDSAMAELYRITRPALVDYIDWKLRHSPYAEDLTQEVFYRLHRRIANGAARLNAKNVGGMLFTIAHNLVADHFKSSAVRMASTNPPEIYTAAGELLTILDRVDPRQDTEASAETVALQGFLRRLLSELVPNQRRALELYYLGEMSLEEVAQALDINVGATKALIYRALNTAARKAGVTRRS